MTVRPGPNLLFAAGVLAGLGVFAFLWPPILAVVAAALLPLAFLAWRDSRSAKTTIGQLAVTRFLPAVVGRDLPFESRITISSKAEVAISGEIRDVPPKSAFPQWNISRLELNASDAVTLTTECRIPIRGKHRFGPIWIRIRGAWGLMEVQREIEGFGEIKVLPETFASSEQLQKDVGATLLLLDKTSRSRQVGAGTEFVSLFPYRLGDDPRRIDWRATARQRMPIVRRYQVERHRDVLILIDSGRLMGAQAERGSKLDCAIDAALHLARVALHGGDRCGIGVFDSSLRGYLAPLAGPKSLGRVVESVYDLQTTWQETDFTVLFAELKQRHAKRCLLVILSDLADAETSRMHCAALARLNRQHLVLFAALQTPLLYRVLRAQPQSVKEAAEQAVALGLLRDRGRAIHALRHGGIHVLDTLPERLTLPLINQFVELRQRNLL